MPSPAKLHKAVLVLSAFSEKDPQRFTLGRMAMRTAHHQQLTPIFPTAYCAAYMTEEEVGRRLREVTLWWYKRCSKIWLCLVEPDAPRLDPLTHDLLLLNEGLMVYPDRGGRSFVDKCRLPVYRFVQEDHEATACSVEPIARRDISHFLRCNITEGLFRGLEG